MRLDGADFVAEAEIYVPHGDQMVVVAKVGQTCEDVPTGDLARLLARNKIRRAEPKKIKREIGP